MQIKNNNILLFLGLLFISCSQDTDITVPRNLQEYLDVNSSLSAAEVIACAASDKTQTAISHIFYYPVSGALDVRYYETDNINQDKNNFSLYRRKVLPISAIFGGYLSKFTRNGEKEVWCLVTYKTDGKLHKSNPIKLKNNTKPTEWKDMIRITYPQRLKPKFSWDDGSILENDIYFQVVSDTDKNLLSGTYTTDKWFQYYVLDNVILNITTETPPALILDKEYNFTMMGVSEDNWVNLVIEKTFIVE